MHMKVIHRVLSLHAPADTIVLVKHVLMGDLDDDLYSVIISKMIKPQLNKENDLMLKFCLEEVLPNTLNVLGDSAPHIVEMTQRLIASLNLWITIKSMFRDNEEVTNFKENKLEG